MALPSTVRVATCAVLAASALVLPRAAHAGETGAPLVQSQPAAPPPGAPSPRHVAPTARSAPPMQDAPAAMSQPATRAEEPASAPAPVDTRFWLAPMLGAGTDGMNFGLGLRGGITLSNRIYLGGSFVYHFGSSSGYTSTTPAGNVSGSVSTSAFYVGPEAGYDFAVRNVVIRPYLGLGFASFHASGSSSGPAPSSVAATSDSQVVAWPGVSVVYDLPESVFFIGGDLRVVTIPGGPSLGFFAFGGMKFGS